MPGWCAVTAFCPGKNADGLSGKDHVSRTDRPNALRAAVSFSFPPPASRRRGAHAFVTLLSLHGQEFSASNYEFCIDNFRINSIINTSIYFFIVGEYSQFNIE